MCLEPVWGHISVGLFTFAGAGVAVGGVRARPKADLRPVAGVAADLGSSRRLRRSDSTPGSAAPPPAAPRGVPGGVAMGLRLGVLPRDPLHDDG